MMATNSELSLDPVLSLTRTFMLDYPADAARCIETMESDEALDALSGQSALTLARIFEKLATPFIDILLTRLNDSTALELLNTLEIRTVTGILSRIDSEKREFYLSQLNKSVAKELRSLLEYPQNTAGSLMKTRVFAFCETTTANEALSLLRSQKIGALNHLYLTNTDKQLISEVDIQRLAVAEGDEPLSQLSNPIKAIAQAFDTRDDIAKLIEKGRIAHVPVVDLDQHLLGVIEGAALIDAIRENLASNMQTMVGASADERALSSSFFAVRKRQPWLQVNLLTAFLAAAVVGLFEDTISEFTALAILLPIAAGQSGNTGAQALAVTMRGLTLKEISMSHWLRVMMKECGAGLMNGIGIAITCSAGIYVWSQSFGLALVMALSMIISMTIAGTSGALVPILLKRFGLDPAQSSSIVLTTVTDIAGFMSFLGIATLLSKMLIAS
ncbi:MAG: magnesium transporter [Candidatus Pelagisphaera sp.]|jgi:magnesium transporter